MLLLAVVMACCCGQLPTSLSAFSITARHCCFNYLPISVSSCRTRENISPGPERIKRIFFFFFYLPVRRKPHIERQNGPAPFRFLFESRAGFFCCCFVCPEV